MGSIKTVNEIVLERMNECVEVLVRKFMNSVRPIYGSTEHGKPYHIGSCVLIEIDKKKYLVTAGHVIDHNKTTTLYVSGKVIPPKRAASKSRINTSPAFSAGRVSLLKPSYAFALE